MSSPPIRVLQVVGGMNRAGVETWLLNVLRNIDRSRFAMDFLVHRPERHDYQDDIERLGSRLLVCPGLTQPWQYARNFLRLLREHGPYHVVHTHMHWFNGFVLRLARFAGVPNRIVHSHLDSTSLDEHAGLPRRSYIALMNHWIRASATRRLAVSGQAAEALFGADWRCCSELVYCSVDFAPFHEAVSRHVVRAELGIPEDAYVVGHVGRLTEPKNHSFFLEIARELARKDPTCWFLLVGDGPLRSLLERQFAAAGLRSNTLFLGSRSDVSRLMLGAMDVFVFPSLYEGLGLALLEAQAAGLECFVSDQVPPEAAVVTALVRWKSLLHSPAHWATAVIAGKHRPRPLGQHEALTLLETSPFAAVHSVRRLESLYSEYSTPSPLSGNIEGTPRTLTSGFQRQ